MQAVLETPTRSKKSLWTGRGLSGLVAAFMLLDAVMKLVKPEFVVKATAELGYPESVIVGLGIVLGACTVLYLIPRTAILGAILLTGYLGGAVASHLRHGDGWFPVLFPVVFGVLLWGGLCLRDERLGTLLPVRRELKASLYE
jgi:hypothetical protein